jgi:amino acid adenylation domain-containing protein
MNHRTDQSMIYPMSITQRQFWLLHQMVPDNPAYNISSAFRIKGDLNVSVLAHCINEIVRRHEIFRTTFRADNAKPVQIVNHDSTIDLSVTELSSQLDTESGFLLKNAINADIVKPFNLSTGPLIRIKLFRLAEAEYLLLAVMHHIITDLQTTKRFTAELSTLYKAYIGNKAPTLSEPQKQYTDYAIWQENWVKSKEFISKFSYWKKNLQNQSGFLNFPTDRQRPSLASLKGATMPINLTKALTNDLKQLSRRELVSLFVTLLAAFIVLLHRYCGQKDIIVGVPFINRRQLKFKDVMGCFVNILPLSFYLPENLSFREILRMVRKSMLGAHRHQEVTFQLITEQLKLKRDLSYNPLYQVGFTFYPPIELELDGLNIQSLRTHNNSSKLDMFVELWDSANGMRGLIEYNTDLFDEKTLIHFIGNYQKLLESIIEDPDQSISKLSILADAEQTQLLVDWNETRVFYPETSCIHHLFEKQVEQSPDAPAVEFGETDMITYAELNERSNQLANYLKKLGIGPDILTGLYVERSIDMVVALLGILKAGGAYVPLDPEFPEQRIAYMLDHSQAPVILTQQRLAKNLPDCATRIVCIDSQWDVISQENNRNQSVTVSPENLAYVIYTSGSTGKPKGVQVHHRAVVNFLSSMCDVPGLNRQDVLLAVTTLSFDISVLEMFLPLIVGAKIVLLKREEAIDGQKLMEVLEHSNISVMQATPATWRLLIAAGWKGSDRLKVLCGGEALPKDLVGELIRRAASVWNMYGPTETTIWSTCYPLTDPVGPILIGKPIANTKIYILDSRNQMVPVGVPGEIFIGGDGVARGYFRDPEKTAERFVPDGFSKNHDARLYRTGDYGRYLNDGNIEYICRIDNQVKIRGFRIELGEIEFVLSQHKQIHEVAVAAKKDAFNVMRLVGYVVPVSGQNPSVESLRSFLSEKLPYYMIPDIFMPLEAMPLTPNEKLDRKGLPDPDNLRPEMDQNYVSPSTNHEKILTDIWAGVLKLDRVGVEDNFFDLGGNSLLSVQVAVRVKQTFGVNVSVIKLFQYPSIRSFADYLKKCREDQQSYHKEEDRAQRRKSALALKRRSIRN